MLGAEHIWTWVVAHVLALLPENWAGTAGELFREGIRAISQFAAEKGLTPDTVAEKGLDLAGRKITGHLTKEHAESEKNYAEVAKAFTEIEDRKIETELKRLSLESDARKREADARIAEADVELKQIQVLDARYELIRKLEAGGMLLHRDDKGNLTIFPKPPDSPSLLPPQVNGRSPDSASQ